MSKPVILITCYTTTKTYESRNQPGTKFNVNYANLQRGRSVQMVSDGMIGVADNTVVAFINRSVGSLRLDSVDDKAGGEIASKLVEKLNSEFGEKYDVEVEVTNHRTVDATLASA